MQSDTILTLLKNELSDYANMSGSVLYSGSNTLKQGQFYLIGLNPGGNPLEIKTTVTQQFQERLKQAPDYNSYCDEEWGRYKKGLSPHQRRVQNLAAVLDTNIRDIFSANMIFTRSTKTETIENYQELKNRCWEVHKYFLSIIQPKIILCLGHQDRKSAFTEVKKFLAPKEKIAYLNGIDGKGGKYFYPQTHGDTSLVIGVPHPSWPSTFWSHLQEFKANLNEKLENSL